MTCLYCQRRIWPDEAKPIPGGKRSDYLCPACDRIVKANAEHRDDAPKVARQAGGAA